MLILRPVGEVFESFQNAETITNFWFDRSSVRLENGFSVQWHRDLSDMTVNVHVTKLEQNNCISIADRF